MVNSVDPDETAPLESLLTWSMFWSTLLKTLTNILLLFSDLGLQK